MDKLFPVSQFQFGFTTSSGKLSGIENVCLDDQHLGVHKSSSRTAHRLVTPPVTPISSQSLPPPYKAWEALYPKGSINPKASIPGGFGFYLSGPKSFSDKLADGATEVTFGYRLMLEEGWEWVKGGKLPGVFGGVGDLSYGCTGGRKEERCKCFNLRPMWRPEAQGELYTYLPLTPANSTRLNAVPPCSKSNPDFGFSVGRGSFHLDNAIGRWVSIAFRVKLNDAGEENGEIEVWIDGTSVISAKELSLCDSKQCRIRGMHFQTFFGGHTEDWASPKDQRAWFADISGAIIG